MNNFLDQNHFTFGKVNGKKRSWWRTYPLHEAVKQDSADLVAKLLMFGADAKLKDMWLGIVSFLFPLAGG